MDALDGLAEQLGHAEDGDGHAFGLADRGAVSRDELLDDGIAQALVAEIVEDRMGDAGVDIGGAGGLERARGRSQGPGRLGHVVHHDDIAARDIADHVEGLGLGRADAALGHDGEAGAQDLGVGGGHLHAADIG